MKTVMICPILDWGFLKQLPQQIAEQFSKNGYKVYFCNNSITTDKIEQINPNLFVYHNYNMLINDIKNKKIKIDILYNTWAKNHNYVDIVSPKITIYHNCDIFDEWKNYEDLMLKKSDIILCTSAYIKRLRDKQYENVHLIRNATDKNFINQNYKTIDRITNVNGFKFAFVGAIGAWVSTYLIKKVAEKYPTFFVGREFGKPCPSNVINLGVKNHNELFDYYNSFDAFLLPFNTKNEITIASCPIKLYEYLSIGKPIVSTSWEETEVFNQNGDKVVFTSNSEEEFLQNIDYVANMNQNERDLIKAKSLMFSLNNTWDDRFAEMENIIKNYCMKKGIKL